MKQLTPLIYLIIIPFFLTITTVKTATCSIEDTPYDKAVAMYKTAVGEKTTINKEIERKIRNLSYTNLLIFRTFCTLPSINRTSLDNTLSRLQAENISFATTRLLASFAKHPGADVQVTWQYLDKIKNLYFLK